MALTQTKQLKKIDWCKTKIVATHKGRMLCAMNRNLCASNQQSLNTSRIYFLTHPSLLLNGARFCAPKLNTSAKGCSETDGTNRYKFALARTRHTHARTFTRTCTHTHMHKHTHTHAQVSLLWIYSLPRAHFVLFSFSCLLPFLCLGWYYQRVSSHLLHYVRDKPIATKTHMPVTQPGEVILSCCCCSSLSPASSLLSPPPSLPLLLLLSPIPLPSPLSPLSFLFSFINFYLSSSFPLFPQAATLCFIVECSQRSG